MNRTKTNKDQKGRGQHKDSASSFFTKPGMR